jgi:hypothetical protein
MRSLKINMTLEEFNKSLEEWRAYCNSNFHSQKPGFYMDCEAYRRIVSMGPQALPFIREAYSKEPPRGSKDAYSMKDWLELAIMEITPKFRMNNKMRPRPEKREKYTRKWLEKNGGEMFII